MTMIRILICALLLGTAFQASASTLYRWVEADGSITFSPKPPPRGTAFETIETGTGIGADGISRTGNARNAPRPAIAPDPLIQSSQPAKRKPGLAYAPASSKLPKGISQSDEVKAAVAARKAENESVPEGDKIITSTKKHSQCQGLQKRVRSLENRLRSVLTPDDVDNTVVAIARYQQSFNRHCDG